MGKTLYEKVYDSHVVFQQEGELPTLFIDRHLCHEVTSPQAFAGLEQAGRRLRHPELTLATMDHDTQLEMMTNALNQQPLSDGSDAEALTAEETKDVTNE